MTVDIRGVNTHNKGAHLMMIAAAARLRDAGFAVSTSPNGSKFEYRAEIGLHQSLVLSQAPRLSAHASRLVPPKIATQFGLIRDVDIDGVVDAAGFAYSDSFSSERSRREAINARRWKRRGVPIVLLPQAFGPFTIPERNRWSAEYLSHVTVAFARDDMSARYVQTLAPNLEVLRAPDFTIGLTPARAVVPVAGDFGALVPNGKLVSHGGVSVGTYLDELAAAGRAFRGAGLEPLVVTHETGDRSLSAQLAAELDAPVFASGDPLVLKGALGQARIALGSRFHALVGSLSQGVPSIAYGWSHKYKALLDDFGTPDALYTPGGDITSLVLDVLRDDSLSATLRERSRALSLQNDDMWKMVESTLRA